jgi:hypothetical protein
VIVAVQETAERFSEGKEEAAWYLMNRTYVDNATEEPLTRKHKQHNREWRVPLKKKQS